MVIYMTAILCSVITELSGCYSLNENKNNKTGSEIASEPVLLFTVMHGFLNECFDSKDYSCCCVNDIV